MRKAAFITVGVVIGSVFALLIVIGVLADTNVIPNTCVVRGSKLMARDVNYLKSLIDFEPSETIEYFYSTNILSIRSEGQFVTNLRVVTYELQDDGEMFLGQARFEEIESLDDTPGTSILTDTELWVYPYDRESFLLYLSVEDGVDREVVKYIEERMQRPRGNW
jgi:hypothetical protein